MFKVGDRVYVTYLSLTGVITSVHPQDLNGETYAMVQLDDYESGSIEVNINELQIVGTPKVPVKHGWLEYKGRL